MTILKIKLMLPGNHRANSYNITLKSPVIVYRVEKKALFFKAQVKFFHELINYAIGN